MRNALVYHADPSLLAFPSFFVIISILVSLLIKCQNTIFCLETTVFFIWRRHLFAILILVTILGLRSIIGWLNLHGKILRLELKESLICAV